ncbi:methyltransferase domain-containing protein [Afipia sp. GAS231]|uniref:methyltransferase domain-containing protein n=1 Tax=Afipia sp. GAS231 TaxID=1882747 RepID=UPI00087DDF64|nr:methyltransferase domain-containing protein [Afipia sp. GAS231]SDN36465.1 Methyltransferase domain-containing protein [Afipia sp. GAS231]
MRTDELIYRFKWLLDNAAAPVFKMRRQPFSPGYQAARVELITSAIDQGLLRGEQTLPAGYGIAMDERVVEYPWVFARLGDVGKMLDAGSTFNHDFLLRRPPLKGADLTIMTLAPEKRCYWHDGYSYVFGDLRKTMFADRTFDTVVSISTIEHIGLDNAMLYTGKSADAENDEGGFVPAVQEFKRILKPGGNCFISVPFGKRDNLGWYQVFDLAKVNRIVEAFAPASHRIDYFGYRRDGWTRASADELANATVYDVHSGKGWGEDRAASSRAIACLQLTA